MSEIQYKQCSKCKRLLPATTEFFYRGKGYMFGVIDKCKPCHEKKQNEWRKKNAEKYAAIQSVCKARWNAKHPHKAGEYIKKHLEKYSAPSRSTAQTFQSLFFLSTLTKIENQNENSK